MTEKEKNKIIMFEGKCRWASIPPAKPRKPYEIDDKNSRDLHYQIEVECSSDKFKKLKKAGIPRLTELKEDDEGNTYITLRATKRKTRADGEDIEFHDLPVLDKYGDTVEDMIANGSTVKCKVEMAKRKGRKGCVLRLKAVQVLNLIPWTAPDAKEQHADVFDYEEKDDIDSFDDSDEAFDEGDF